MFGIGERADPTVRAIARGIVRQARERRVGGVGGGVGWGQADGVVMGVRP